MKFFHICMLPAALLGLAGCVAAPPSPPLLPPPPVALGPGPGHFARPSWPNNDEAVHRSFVGDCLAHDGRIYPLPFGREHCHVGAHWEVDSPR